jgi:hypothetical protein
MNDEPTTTKTFPTLAVCGVLSGRVLEEKGFSGIHEVMDHFYPGIMTMGVAAMGDAAADEVARQVPTAPRWKESDDWREYGARCLSILGPTLDLVGPHRVTTDDAGKAFAKFVEGIRR